MSQKTSPATGRIYGLERVCNAWGVSRSSFYAQCKRSSLNNGSSKAARGPKPIVSDSDVLERVREDIKASLFRGEGHRKIHARIRRQGTVVGKGRVLRVMRENRLLSPHRRPVGEPNTHDGTIVTEKPNEIWATDGIRIDTADDGLVWGFFLVEHWNSECLGWHVCKKGDAQAALEPLKQGLRRYYGAMGRGAALGLTLREDHGSQYTSE